MSVRNSIPLEGVLNCWTDPYDLPDLLLAVIRSGKTGRLSFSNAEGDKTISVRNGKIVFAESSSEDDGLGQFLLRNGQLSLADFTRVSKLVSPGKRLGALLVAEGVLEPKDLVPAVVGQVRAIILGLFRRTETWYGFKEEELSRKESITLDMPVAQLVLDGLQLVESWRRISKGVGDLDAVYQVTRATEVEWSRLELESGPTELLALLNEPMRISDVCDQVSLDAIDACRYLWAFKSLQWIEAGEISVEAAAELAEKAEMLPPLEKASPVPIQAPPAPLTDLAKTVVHVEPPAPAIPQRLVQTQVSAEPSARAEREPQASRGARAAGVGPRGSDEKPSARAERKPEGKRPPKPAPSPSVPASLANTQLAVDRPETPPPSPATTRPVVVAPHHTQLFIDSPPEPSAPSPSTTGEMMEAILDGKADAADAPQEPTAMRPDSATQFFAAASALEPPPPPPEEDLFHGSPGFASLSLDYAAASPPPAAEAESAPSASSFAELAPEPAPQEEMPLIEATVVEEAAPLPPQLVATQPSLPVSPSGLELFAMNDPFQDSGATAPPPAPFATDDPLQYAETSVAAALPPRPKTEELDLDIGHFFTDEPE
jgi:hypothetical protein